MAVSPAGLKELAAGFLFTEGIIGGVDEINKLEEDSDQNVWVDTKKEVPLAQARRRILTSGCGRGVSLMLSEQKLSRLKSDVKIKKETLTGQIKSALALAEEHRSLGGTHLAAVFSADTILAAKEDIGRHNCLDKAIGDLLLKGKLKEACVLFSTGRISSEMALKAVRSRIPIIVSLSSPTDAAVELGEKYGLTVIGYARGRNMSLYTHKDRII
jgi:FdhD protein